MVKPAKPWQTLVAQASQPAVSQVSKPACRGLSNPRANAFALMYAWGFRIAFKTTMKYPG
jgi:hypothetical protein